MFILKWLFEDLSSKWELILSQVNRFRLTENSDKISWKLGKKGIFTVKLVDIALKENETGLQFKHIWTGKLPAKINFFMWLIENGAL